MGTAVNQIAFVFTEIIIFMFYFGCYENWKLIPHLCKAVRTFSTYSIDRYSMKWILINQNLTIWWMMNELNTDTCGKQPSYSDTFKRGGVFFNNIVLYSTHLLLHARNKTHTHILRISKLWVCRWEGVNQNHMIWMMNSLRIAVCYSIARNTILANRCQPGFF